MKKQNFIPISSAQIIDDLCTDNTQLRKLFNLLNALYQYNFYNKLTHIKQNYQAFDPDSDLLQTEKIPNKQKLLDDVDGLLVDANYESLSITEIEKSINAQMQSGLNIEIDLDDFEVLKIYVRGRKNKTINFRHWKKFKKQSKQVTQYQRVLLVIKLKNIEARLAQIKDEKSKKKLFKKITKSRKNMPTDSAEQFIFVKLFKDIASGDLEMLFPNRKIKLKTFDKVRLSLTSGTGTVLGVVSTTGKIVAASTNIFGILVALGGLGGIVFKQVMNIFNKRTQYMAALSSQLYFHNLDNNFGAITHILDAAFEQEIKEIVLAYYFLNIAEKPLTQTELDLTIEQYLTDKYHQDIDFEVDDGLKKLLDNDLLIGKDKFSVKSVQTSYDLIDAKWDGFF